MPFEKCFNLLLSVQVGAVVESLERDMELLCVTGVEDKLQDNVRNTLEQVWVDTLLNFDLRD